MRLPLSPSESSRHSVSPCLPINISAKLIVLVASAVLACCGEGTAGVLINEVMFHPAGIPEPTNQEWIELINPDAVAADVAGWRFSNGVDYTLPAGTTIAAGGYLVVAADRTAFLAAHAGFNPALVVGGWTGRLSNSGEHIEIKDTLGTKVDEVTYADEGDWGIRGRGPFILNHRGWIWTSDADGGGKTLELRNTLLGNGSGQNWGASAAVGGTPGAANSIRSGNIAPLIKDAKHHPEIPRSTDPIVVTCQLEDELPGAIATLRWRLDGAANFQSVAMTDTDGDGNVEGVIPAQANLAVVEWYISATDGANTRTWPAPARTSDIGVVPETFGQATNALVQVDNGFNPATDFTVAGNQSIYRIIMTEAERAELAQIGSNGGDADSDAQMNATFISFDGTGIKTRYRTGVRNRGNTTRVGRLGSNNYHVSFPSDSGWNGRSSIQINFNFPYSQALGAALFTRAGIAPQECSIVQVRVNGVNLAQTDRYMFGRYARLEPLDSEWTEHHFPNDPDGNLYRLDDHAPNPVGNPPGDLGSGEFRFEGTDPAAYSDTFGKETNQDDNDWTDLINLCRIVSAPATGGTAGQPAIPNDQYIAAVSTVLDLDEFYTYFATDALIGNQEGGLPTGRADDTSIYRGVVDPRFRFVPHDLDDVFDIGGEAGSGATRSIFSYDTADNGIRGITRLFNHPQLVPRYYAKVLECMDSWFNSSTVNPIIDQIMAGWVPATESTPTNPRDSIAEIKAYVTARRANVLNQIQQNYSLDVTTTATDVDGFKRTSDGAATISGTFNVAKTYSITVNGTPAQWFYRTAGPDAAGTWKLVLAAGSPFLKPGLNKVFVNFWDQPNGTGNIIQSLSTEILYDLPGQSLSGILQAAGSISMIAPANYVPGVPMLVRVDLKDAQGNLDRLAWNRTATLTATNGVTLNPNTVQLLNGMGSALVTIGSSGGGGQTQTIFSYGTGGTGTAAVSGVGGSVWKTKTDFTNTTLASFVSTAGSTWKNEGFDDSTWVTRTTQTGYGDGDENQTYTQTDYDAAAAGTQSGPVCLFRNTFTVADASVLAAMSGQVKYDDGAVVYVNGTEVARSTNLSPTAALTDYANFNGAPTTENATLNFTVPLNLVHNGVNTIAVEVHQHDNGSSDMTFDLRLQATLPGNDPGNFALSASIGSLTAQKAITSAGATPTITNVGGTLPAGTTTWSGITRVTSDVTVPAGSTLNIDAGTIVLVDGTATPGDSTGKKITVNGALNSNGTAASPVQITGTVATDRWGQILFSAAQPSTLNYTLLSHAGHAPGVGHTGRGPMLRLTGSNLTLNDSVVADGPAKAVYTSGTCSLTLERSLITRMITGPELEDGVTFLAEDSNIQLILPDYRESNASAPDDEDCLYIHNGSGRPVVVRRCAFVRCGDDVFDCLGGPITVEDSVLREGWDKGMSLLDNDLTISRTLIVDCDKAIVPKSTSASVPRVINVDRCTMSSQDHDTSQAPFGYPIAPSNPDPDTPSTGLYTQNKAGQSNTSATISITASNCIIEAKEPVKIDAPYDPANTVVTYSCTHDVDTAGATTWPGTGNIEADPLFVDVANRDVHLQASSPCRDTGNPAQTDADGSRADMGALPYAVIVASGTVTWSPAGGPYRIVNDVTVPTGLTLVIQAGTSVYFDQAKKITVNGTLKVQGTEGAHVVFSHPPGAVATGDADPIAPGAQTGPPKWEGIRIVGPGSPDPMSTGHEIRYADFINAQPGAAANNQGSLGVIRAEALVDHCTWRGTHLRMLYGRNCSLIVTHCVFPDMFNPLDDAENPTSSSYNLDNIAEPMKIELPVGDAAANPQLVNNPNYVLGLPVGGVWRVYFNDFYGNKGHNDVFDADSGRWGQTQILDCRYNYFHGLTGDEHIDLGGDAYVASNIFERGHKDIWTNDRGYSNCISSGDKGSGTTIWVVRNLAFDVDHVINCKVSTGAIFEHNTISNLHADFDYSSTPPVAPFTQAVKCSAVNLFVPEDTAPQAGDGAYVAYNLFNAIPRVISWADLPTGATSKLEAANNYLNNVTDNSVGPDTATYHGGLQHPGGFTSLGSFVAPGDPRFVNVAGKDFSLQQGSPARGTAAGGLDYGASVAEWTYILGGPAAQTAATDATFTIGGPGMVAYKWRLDGGAWSAPIQIGSGGIFPRTGPTVRTATLSLTNLANGPHNLEVIGQDPAGNWQDADPAKSIQVAPTSRTWAVNPALVLVQLNEILADTATAQLDAIELYNGSGAPVALDGWSLSDNPTLPAKYAFPAGTSIPAGGYFVVNSAQSLINLDKDGDGVYLYQGGVLKDSITFGHQVPDLSIGRLGLSGSWALCTPTLGGPNIAARTGPVSNIRINEWFTDGHVLYDNDWIELGNTGDLPVDLSGLKLEDNTAGSPHMHTLAPLSFIAANGYVKLIADGHPEIAPTHLDFSLDPEQESIALYDLSGKLLDTVAYYPQTTDYSMWRDSSGVAGFGFRELPSGGFEIATTDPLYLNALAILHGLRITEVMFNPIGGNEYEYVELKNVGATPLELAGVKFVEGIDFTFGALTLNAGQTVVVVKNLDKFRVRYGATPVVAGTYIGSLDNSGETLGLQLPPPFDANVMTFRFSDTWYSLTDGLGAALSVPNPLLKSALWDDRETWLASELGGSPNGIPARSDNYTGWSALHGAATVTDDSDKDGVFALVEFGLGMNPANPNNGNGKAGAPIAIRGPQGRVALYFLVPQNAVAAQGHGMLEAVYTVEASSDFVTWNPIGAKSFTTSWTGTGSATLGSPTAGFIPVTVEDEPGAPAKRFLRLQVSYVPQ